jgi:hypothetical protein
MRLKTLQMVMRNRSRGFQIVTDLSHDNSVRASIMVKTHEAITSSVVSLKFVEEVEVKAGSRESSSSVFVIPARLLCLAREESRISGPFARQPRARVTSIRRPC